jgi:hypothetical protein
MQPTLNRHNEGSIPSSPIFSLSKEGNMSDQPVLASDFQTVGTDVVAAQEQDPWLTTYVLSADQVAAMIAEAEVRIREQVRRELRGAEYRLQSQINEEQIKRRYLKTLVLEYVQQFTVLKRFLTP